ncbi:TetR/AcrR family transcriptional regulator [Cupriavidus campinensis]
MARPRQFDAAAALAAAQDTFLDKGYQATSTRELTQAMGLTQPSLYNAFGDKRSLFLLALDDYLNQSLRARITRAESNHPPAQALVAFFAESVERALGDPRHRGCMLINASLDASSDDPALRQVVADELEALRAFFERTVRAAQAAGTIDPSHVPEDVAANLLAVQVGLRVLSRVMPERTLLEAMVRQALRMLDLVP